MAVKLPMPFANRPVPATALPQIEQIAQMAERSSDAAAETADTARELDASVAVMTSAVGRYRL
jgi:hypothetical protein